MTRPLDEKLSNAVGDDPAPGLAEPAAGSPSAPPASPAEAFRADLVRAVAPLQRGLETLLALVTQGSASATELARALRLEPTLAWRVWRMVRARSSEEAAGFIVGSSALEKLLTACRKRGADESVTAAVREAHRTYQAFVERRAGDEATLRSMLAAIGAEPDAWEDNQRRMFAANRLRAGVQAASQLRCCIMYPGTMEGIASAAVIDMFSQLWWMRAERQAVFRVVRLFHTHAPADPGAPVVHLATPLDPPPGADPGPSPALPYVRPFCEGNSTLVEREHVAGSMVYTIRPAALGRDHATTLCFGEIQHDCILPLAEDPQMIFSTASMVPSEMLVLEVYVYAPLVREGFVFRPMITDALFRSLETGLWAPRVEPASIGGTFAAIDPTPLVDSPTKSAGYRDLVQFAFERLRMERKEFYCYRLRLPTPPLGLMVSLIAGEDPGRP